MSLTLLALCTCSACALKANINRHFRPLRKHVREPMPCYFSAAYRYFSTGRELP